jgi:glucose uptake protein
MAQSRAGTRHQIIGGRFSGCRNAGKSGNEYHGDTLAALGDKSVTGFTAFARRRKRYTGRREDKKNMLVIQSYGLAVALCFVTMLCWGSWANTQKLATKAWPFQLFYWDYAIGVFLLSLLFAFTLGSSGTGGRSFLIDLHQADSRWLGSALLGGVVFNVSNILLVAAIDIAGMSVAFPLGVGLALVIGVVTTYIAKPEGNVPMIAAGVGCVVIAMVFCALAYRKMASAGQRTPGKGLLLSVVAGVLMGAFYSFVAQSLGAIDAATLSLEPGKLSPYTAIFMFSTGLLLSNFLWNSIVMAKPFHGPPVSYRDYFVNGNARLHFIGLLGGLIWNIGMSFSVIASSAAGPALSYGLGQGATLVGAVWGVFIWKEFRGAPAGTNRLLAAMFVFYLVGLGILIGSKA